MQSHSTDIILLTPGAARTLTDNIKELGDELGAMLLEAHDGEAWRALGYKSWKAYIEAEFEFNRQRSYQLLKQAKVNAQLAEAGGGHVTEREARDLSTTVDTSAILHETQQRREIQTGKRRSSPGPRGLVGVLDTFERSMVTLNDAFESAGDDAIAYLDADSRRAMERTITHLFEFASEWAERLAQPVTAREADEWAAPA